MNKPRGNPARQDEHPGPARAPGVPLEQDPPSKSSEGIERNPEVAKFAECGRSAPAGDIAKKHEAEQEAEKDFKLQPNSNVDNREARFHAGRHKTH
ncbi:hypothetical protein HDU86_007874 [Geranomyces michiganensis]|nr:hypothetical protein HDU86_007874 [Geranomyces michiganensis]